MKLLKSIIVVFVLFIPAFVAAEDLIKNTDLGDFFNGFEGCFICYSEKENIYTVYNEDKTNVEISPCSTFKIYHSLIGLETGVLNDENTIINWDGTRYQIRSWNKDQTLKEAVRNSVVWYFQETAKRIGAQNEQKYLDSLNYGNKDISGGLTEFWLQSSLKISPRKQLDLLRKLNNYSLPFSKRNVDIVKNILLLSSGNGSSLYGKTGTGVENGRSVNGWFIGCIENTDNIYYFVTNIRGESGAAGNRAKQITERILNDLNVFSYSSRE